MRTLSTAALVAFALSAIARAASPAPHDPKGFALASGTFKQYCQACHAKGAPQGGINLEQMIAERSFASRYEHWERVAAALEEKRMPPPKMPSPAEADRAQAAAFIRAELAALAKASAGDPGPVTVRRLTRGEYNYSIQDLIGFDLDAARDFESDSVGGEGFANFGDVQFVADANLERYLEAAKRVASHAVIGADRLAFFQHPGESGKELSAIDRIQEIYRTHGFRTVSGEGGLPFGLHRYGKALYASWRYRHRAKLGEPKVTLAALAAREGTTARFVEHIWTVLNRPDLGYPAAEVAARWKKLPEPDSPDVEKSVRASCEEIQKYLTTWPSYLFARGDVAAGGAGDERPLEFSDNSLRAEPKSQLRYFTGFRGGPPERGAPPPKTASVYLNIVPMNPHVKEKPLIIWRGIAAAFRPAIRRGVPPVGGVVGAAGAGAAMRSGPATPRLPIRNLVSKETAERLKFGQAPAGIEIGPDDFVTEGSTHFEVPLPEGMAGIDAMITAELAGNRDHVLRFTIAERADGVTRGVPVWALIGDTSTPGYRTWKDGVMEFARDLPPNSHSEPTPADKDPIPAPFDKVEYNKPERDAFIVKAKYIRDDRFVVDKMLDDATRARLDKAWSDLYASFDYFDAYLKLLESWYKIDLKGQRLADLSQAAIAKLPREMATFVEPLRARYDWTMRLQQASRATHLNDTLRFASRAWRRPLTIAEQAELRAFYRQSMTELKLDHEKAVRAVIARVLVAPAFLYRFEQGAAPSSPQPAAKPTAGLRPAAFASNDRAALPLSNWELATRLSYLLWSSIPDEELRRAAAAGELSDNVKLKAQVRRMLADPRSKRMASEFFGQWLGFYRFDLHRGVDTARFPEFTPEVRASMYEEAIAFFAHVLRNDRPMKELIHADYTFVDATLAKFYGITLPKDAEKSSDPVMVSGDAAARRGGLLRLGAVLTATSAPLRTSPVKRGDWLLRRVIGTPVPPPPANAGTLPADPKQFGEMTLKQRLEAHKRNATCAGCHSRIDPLGFPLERYDSTGRWRDNYGDGKAIDDQVTLAGKNVNGVDGLLDYLRTQDAKVLRTFSRKLIGYALGRTVLLSDQPLIDRMSAAGSDTPISAMIVELVASPQFRMRRAPEPESRQTASAAAHTEHQRLEE